METLYPSETVHGEHIKQLSIHHVIIIEERLQTVMSASKDKYFLNIGQIVADFQLA